MKTTKEMIAVMQAYEDGETIQRQVSGGGIWTTVSSDSTVWDWRYFDYRVKPAESKKVMMQMWRDARGYEVAYPAKTLVGYQTKIGFPFEFVYPEGYDT
mgnify:CR=1 FL=1|tara:strand:- start:710 stop:1006 length:297 start_codon:yes stop_codon:yes gene_type:complete